MSIGALELSSLFRKYTGTLADIDLSQGDAQRNYDNTRRDLSESRLKNKTSLSNKMAGQGLAQSGISLKENVDLENAYTTAGADADAQHQANLTKLAKQRLDAKGDYDEGVALSQLTSLLQK